MIAFRLAPSLIAVLLISYASANSKLRGFEGTPLHNIESPFPLLEEDPGGRLLQTSPCQNELNAVNHCIPNFLVAKCLNNAIDDFFNRYFLPFCSVFETYICDAITTCDATVCQDLLVTWMRCASGCSSFMSCFDPNPGNCSDGIQNGDEEGVDCGGRCFRLCPPTCSDGIQNGDETGTDCGGSCPDCPVPSSEYNITLDLVDIPLYDKHFFTEAATRLSQIVTGDLEGFDSSQLSGYPPPFGCNYPSIIDDM
jgi:hypothetical protein